MQQCNKTHTKQKRLREEKERMGRRGLDALIEGKNEKEEVSRRKQEVCMSC